MEVGRDFSFQLKVCGTAQKPQLREHLVSRESLRVTLAARRRRPAEVPHYGAERRQIWRRTACIARVSDCITLHRKFQFTKRKGSPEVATLSEVTLDAEKTYIQRRAWDSNPQPLSGHLISSQTAGRSL